MTQALRRRLVHELEQRRLIRSRPVRDAFLAVPREHFVPEVDVERVYRDEAIATRTDAHGVPLSSSSQPAIMALMLEALDVEPGHRVLEVGAGTGYNAALLSRLVGRRGRVVSVDIDSAAAGRARSALESGGFAAQVVVGDGREGWPDEAPYDRIIVTASAAEVSRAWHDQLRSGGLLEVPLRLRADGAAEAIPTLRKEPDGFRSVSALCGGFMPLRDSPEGYTDTAPLLAVTAAGADGHEQLLHVTGAGVAQLSPSGRRRLLSLLLARPRTLRRLGRRNLEGLFLYASVRIPERRFVAGSEGIGLVERSGRGAALLTAGGRVVGYGADEAGRSLLALVDEWVERGRPSETAFDVSVEFDGDASSVRYGFRDG